MDYKEIIKEYKAPFYLYDIPELKKRVDMMRGYQKNIGLCFAMKAAPLLAGYIAPFVDRLEVCSPGEYEICVRDNVAPEKILVSGVNKTRESMARILSLGGAAGLFTIESEEQFEILEDTAKGLAIENHLTRSDSGNNLTEKAEFKNDSITKLRVYIRLSSGNQFGVDKATFEKLCDKVINSDFLELVGIHYFSGTQKSIKKIEKELAELSSYGSELKEKYVDKLAGNAGLSLEYGPGLGIDYFVKSEDTDSNIIAEKSGSSKIEEYRYNESFLAELMDAVQKSGIENSFSDITFEHGRYIAAPCGKYFTGVADVKTTDGTNFAILEGGLHQISYFGSMAGMKVPYVDYYATSENHGCDDNSSEKASDESSEVKDYVLAGSLCSANDILVRKISLPVLDIGDTLCFNFAGAYCATEGISLFLSRDLPAIIIRDIDGNVSKVRDHIETNIYNGGY